jgi:hypothetical protein
MLHVTVILEDGLLTATHHDGLWNVTLCDALTGKEHPARWSGPQLAAVLALAVAGDDAFDQGMTLDLYSFAEPLFADPCPPECRLIP